MSKLSPESESLQVEWEIGECVGSFYRPNFEQVVYPYLPAHITRPKETKKVYMVRLPESCYFAVPSNLKLLAVPLCGGNIDVTTLGRVIDRGLAADCRLVRFVAEVSDRAGGIAEVTSLLSEHGASVKDVFHERAWLQSAVDRVQIKFIIECTGS